MCIICDIQAELKAQENQGQAEMPKSTNNQSQADLDYQRAQTVVTLANAAKTLDGINAIKEKEAVLATLMDLLAKDSVATAPTRDSIPGEDQLDELPKELRDLIAALGGELGVEVRTMRFPKA